MSLEIVLIPLAIAAVGAWSARADRAAGANCFVETRWRDTGLLSQALDDLGAEMVEVTDNGASASIDGVAVRFVRGDDGVMTAHFPAGTDIDDAVATISQVDGAYTRRVQGAVYHRLRARVAELGYTVESETIDGEETVTLVVNVD